MFHGRKVYIAGPMTGLPDANRPAFHEAAKFITDHGGTPLNPAVQPDGLTYCQYMRYALNLLDQADVVVMLSGYHASLGARFEFDVAHTRKRVPILYFKDLKTQLEAAK